MYKIRKVKPNISEEAQDAAL